MLRHLPNRCKRERIEEHVRSLGFPNFTMHLPLDTRTGVNKGYCFVRFQESHDAWLFCQRVFDTQIVGTKASTKRLMAILAANQGAPLKPRMLQPQPQQHAAGTQYPARHVRS